MGGALWRTAPEHRRLFAAPSCWSFEERVWRSNDLLELKGRLYPGKQPGITLTIEVQAERGTLEAADLVGAPPLARGPQPLTVIERWLAAVPAG